MNKTFIKAKKTPNSQEQYINEFVDPFLKKNRGSAINVGEDVGDRSFIVPEATAVRDPSGLQTASASVAPQAPNIPIPLKAGDFSSARQNSRGSGGINASQFLQRLQQNQMSGMPQQPMHGPYPQQQSFIGPRIGFAGLQQGIFGNTRDVTQAYGNYNPQLEPNPTGRNIGVDLRANQDTLTSPFHGVVVQRFVDDGTRYGDRSGHKGYGNSVLVRLDSGEMLRFSHLADSQLQQGDEINAGDVIGVSGATGNATGPHLDLEYYNQQGKIDNPENFLGFTQPQQNQTPQQYQEPQQQPENSSQGAKLATDPFFPQPRVLGASTNIPSGEQYQQPMQNDGFLSRSVASAGRAVNAPEFGVSEALKDVQTPDLGVTEAVSGDFSQASKNLANTLGVKKDFGVSEFFASKQPESDYSQSENDGYDFTQAIGSKVNQSLEEAKALVGDLGESLKSGITKSNFIKPLAALAGSPDVVSGSAGQAGVADQVDKQQSNEPVTTDSPEFIGPKKIIGPVKPVSDTFKKSSSNKSRGESSSEKSSPFIGPKQVPVMGPKKELFIGPKLVKPVTKTFIGPKLPSTFSNTSRKLGRA